MKKINIAELLKDCPKGMELDCVMFEKVTLVEVDFNNCDYPITISASGERHSLSRYGEWFDEDVAKCIIFPKGKTTWEGFIPPCKFKDGDIVSVPMYIASTWIGIFKRDENNEKNFESYCSVNAAGEFINICLKNHSLKNARFASENEKQELFKAIKANGYKWNPETKTLERLIKPKFKVGDKIKLKNSPSNIISTVTKINDDGSICVNDYTWVIKYELQDKYELVPNKFDITTLKSYKSEILYRNSPVSYWKPAFWGKYIPENSNHNFLTTNGFTRYCIPFEGNEHLLGSTDDCSEYYKTWKE